MASAHAAAIRASNDPVKDERPITAKDREHWAWRPLIKVDAANLDAVVAKKTPIENEADAATLIRRVTFDLTGLPPSASDLSDLSDWSDQKYEALVGRLLDSPRYGEHWAQWWLDLARFAESDGFEFDAVRERAWQYRDWVIAALNADTPLDVFVQQQLAGDLTGAETATGFLMAGPDMPDVNNQVERRHIFLNDMTATVGTVCLGLTFGCAQCHDHPYDPISQADFYRLRAFFDATVMPKERKPMGPVARVVTDGVPASVVFVRGESKRPGPAVQPAFPRIGLMAPTEAEKLDRVALAKWITSRDNVLFARSMANRLWQQHFGKPLAGNPGDLGHQGEAPTHPELLDWLAAELPRQNWSLKKLHKLIVMSRTYRQALPQQRRLTGEMLRDTLISLGEGLNTQTGGSSVRLPLPKEISDTLLKKQADITPDAAQHRRRSIYTFARRNQRNPLFELFDRPDAQASCSRRNESTTAPQALAMLNSDFVHETAASLSKRLTTAHGSETEKIIEEVTRLCLSRNASQAEIEAGKAFIEKQVTLAGSFDEAVKDYCLAVLNSNAFVFVD
ncbi:MAG: DUF1553 domain-containing protein [Verrucomicrobiaceae bacterium]|nr:DUF1553 domain-containing protein [Verrucomicrobiaceae bacterium]